VVVSGVSQRKAEYPLTQQHEIYITRCMMLGCVFVYDDFGHPERRHARKYHRCIGENVFVGFGRDEAEAAYDYLRRYHPDLL
jgi:hypothetical protein